MQQEHDVMRETGHFLFGPKDYFMSWDPYLALLKRP